MEQVLAQLVGSLGLVRAEVLLCLAASLWFLLAVTVTLRSRTWGLVSLTVLLAVVATQLVGEADPATASLAGVFRADAFSHFARLLAYLVGLTLVYLSLDKVPEGHGAEYFGCLFLVTAGMGLAAAANDLILLFLALELVSIPTYVLLYLLRADLRALEATTKYFFLSLFAAAMFLYGATLLFGAVGTTNLEGIRVAIAHAVAQPDGPGLPAILLVSLVMIVAAMGFRLTAAPFHFYAPDVYEGAPTLTVTMLASVPKVVGIVGLVQLVLATLVDPGLAGALTGLAPQAAGLFWIMALVSMCLGNMLGLWQEDLKRLLAYSGVAHAGYLLLGLGAACQGDTAIAALPAVLFYLVIYTLTTLGSFAVLLYLDTPDRPVRTVDDLAGLAKSHPLLAFCLAACMFSLTGLPPTAGFLAKLNLFLAAWGTGQSFYQVLALVMAVNAAIGAWYYLRIVGVMYLRDAIRPLHPRPSVPTAVVALAAGGLLLWLFFSPAGVYSWAAAASQGVPPVSAEVSRR